MNSMELVFIVIAGVALAFTVFFLLKYRSVKKNLRTIQLQKNNYEVICNQAHDAVLVLDIVNGHIQKVNLSLAQMLGYSIQQLEHLSIFDLHPKEYLSGSAEIIADVWEKKGLVYSNLPFITSKGEHLPVECSAKVVEFDCQPAIVIYARDIRERLKLEKEIREKNDIIERKNRDMLDSIQYASRIQNSVLPVDKEFYSLFPDSFILYKPKDIVSGDFYWISRSGLLAVCDCTGHGVPGAFMSMLCTTLLNEAVISKQIFNPAEILNYVRSGIIAALKQKGSSGEQKDGMDCSLIRFVDTLHPTMAAGQVATSLQIACANNPVFIIRNGQLTEFKPDRQPVAISDRQKPFTLHEFWLQKGDTIYLTTDGFEDQFGGPFQSPQLGGGGGKKFKIARLKELLIEIAPRSMVEQKSILEKTFTDWKGETEQTDDMIVIGVRV